MKVSVYVNIAKQAYGDRNLSWWDLISSYCPILGSRSLRISQNDPGIERNTFIETHFHEEHEYVVFCSFLGLFLFFNLFSCCREIQNSIRTLSSISPQTAKHRFVENSWVTEAEMGQEFEREKKKRESVRERGRRRYGCVKFRWYTVAFLFKSEVQTEDSSGRGVDPIVRVPQEAVGGHVVAGSSRRRRCLYTEAFFPSALRVTATHRCVVCGSCTAAAKLIHG